MVRKRIDGLADRGVESVPADASNGGDVAAAIPDWGEGLCLDVSLAALEARRQSFPGGRGCHSCPAQAECLENVIVADPRFGAMARIAS